MKRLKWVIIVCIIFGLGEVSWCLGRKWQQWKAEQQGVAHLNAQVDDDDSDNGDDDGDGDDDDNHGDNDDDDDVNWKGGVAHVGAQDSTPCSMKNTIWDGGSTALYAAYAVDMVHTVDMV